MVAALAFWTRCSDSSMSSIELNFSRVEWLLSPASLLVKFSDNSFVLLCALGVIACSEFRAQDSKDSITIEPDRHVLEPLGFSTLFRSIATRMAVEAIWEGR